MTGMALGWTAPTSLLGSVVRNANKSLVVSPSLTFLTDFHYATQMPAKNANGLSLLRANQTGGFVPSGKDSFSEKLMNCTRQRFSNIGSNILVTLILGTIRINGVYSVFSGSNDVSNTKFTRPIKWLSSVQSNYNATFFLNNLSGKCF